MIFAPLVKTVEELPQTGNQIGDKRLVLFNKKVYEWTEAGWVLAIDCQEYVDKYFTIKR